MNPAAAHSKATSPCLEVKWTMGLILKNKTDMKVRTTHLSCPNIKGELWSMPVLFQNLESLEQLSQVLLEQTWKVLSSVQQKLQIVAGMDLM
jgi:hypothetical protein